MMKGEYFEVALEQVKELAQDFDSNKGYYLSPEYQESEVRKDFIDKFLIALGWDVNHEIQKNPFQQEVKVERGVAAGQSQRRADYAFYVAPNFNEPRLFVEAKKPFTDLCSADNCFQVIRYGWNAKVPIAVLTDFEEIAVLDCRYKPDVDTAALAVIERYHYLQYSDTEKFKRIFYLFSRDEVSRGSIDKFAQTLPKRRGKAVQRGLFKGGWQPVDESFLEELDTHREALAKNFKNHNFELDGETLTEVTQRTLDRLVFLRFLEDKFIEPKYYVSEFGEKGNPWREFIALCRRLDNVYNGIVFKKHDILDKQTLKVDESQFADICEELSHINSPYDFNSIPIHILGSIYERFLGKVIVVTNKGVRVEEKPEVRKAGGIYYTPDYIVRYIVESTVGKIIEGKTPTQVAKMRFADIACGSGSFLLSIYDLLLCYYRDWYNENPEKAEKAGCIKRDDGYWHLSLKQRREILLNNIYGVDIDHQAVEVAQLSLYLKLLEEETTASTRQYQLELQETLLPPLDKNIVWGNSLVGMDIFNGQLFPSEEERKLNPMDFDIKFPKVISKGGFDAIVGNPPYITYALGRGRPKHLNAEVAYLASHYEMSSEYKMNSFAMFYERAILLCRVGGFCGYIVPGTILINKALTKIRKHLLETNHLLRVVSLKYRVFPGSEMGDSAILLVKKEQIRNYSVELNQYNSEDWEINYSSGKIRSRTILKLQEARIYLGAADYRILRIGKRPGIVPLDVVAKFYNGIKTGNNKQFLSECRSSEEWQPVIRGRDFDRYGTAKPKWFVYFDPKKLWSNTDETKLRTKGKVIIRQTGDRLCATLDPTGHLCLDTVHIIYESIHDHRFLLGLINSKFLDQFHQCLVPEFGKTFAEVKIANLKKLPIPQVGLSEKAHHDRIIELVIKILEAKKLQGIARTDKDKEFYESKCEALDHRIDQLVYELYGLSEEEINIVEGKALTKDKS